MNILYVSYWGLNEGITQSSVIPTLEAIKRIKPDTEISLITFERENTISTNFNTNFKHFPIQSLPVNANPVKRYFEFKSKLNDCYTIHKKIHPDLIIARGVFAGRIGNILYEKFKTPYIVESFEPHVDYMVNGGVWKKNGVKAKILKNWMAQQLKNAHAIVTVSDNYLNELKRITGRRNVHFIPCVVDQEKFFINTEIRNTTREQLELKNQITGIYIGKFGGIYYNEEAFIVFKKCFEKHPNLKIILLTNEDKTILIKKISAHGMNPENFIINFVKHNEVNNYLNAADFAFSLIKSTPSSKYCSPIKNGEYWACGLPILIPDNIGDDSQIIKNNPISGAVFTNFDSSLTAAINQVNSILHDKEHRQKIRALIFKYRSKKRIDETYLELLH